jgi:hypothetical protein
MFFHADDARSSATSHDKDIKSTPKAKQTTVAISLCANGVAREGHLSADHGSATLDNSKHSPVSRATISVKAAEPTISARLKSPQVRGPPPKDLSSFGGDLRWPNLHHPAIQDAALSQGPNLVTHSEMFPLSIDTSKRFYHIKSSSMDASPQAKSREQNALINSLAVPTSPLSGSLMETQPRPDINSDVNGDATSLPVDAPLSSPHAPSSIKEENHHFSRVQNMNKLAANARRERKVLDLEISNSSLLAINRALEREMRKQNAELRQLRRLNRCSRLSIAASLRSVSGDGLSILSELDDTESDQSSCHSNEESSDTSDNESSNGDAATANSASEGDSRPCSRDERRFLRDLSKHQELLVDSQKMNQSIKRCLGWTENLIQEAKRALEYHVRVSEIEIGGRVLAPDEVDGESEGRQLHSSQTREQSPLPVEESLVFH